MRNFFKFKPCIGDLKINEYPGSKKEILNRLISIIKDNNCRSLKIVAGEVEFFKFEEMIKIIKEANRIKPIKIELVTNIEENEDEKFIQQIINELPDILTVYHAQERPEEHYILLSTHDKKTFLMVQDQHDRKKYPKKEYFIVNSVFGKWRSLIAFWLYRLLYRKLKPAISA